MFLETKRLIIRSLNLSDEKALIGMASDGSLTEIFGDCSECHKWMGDFIRDAIKLETEDNPQKLIATAHVKNIASCKTLERTGFFMVGTKMYQDLYDKTEELSNIYELVRDM